MPKELTTELILQYFAFVFVATCGVIQIAAAYSRLRGLLFLKKPLASHILGGVLILGSFLGFFLAADRNRRGLEGTEQFGYFMLGGIAAVVFSLILSSLINLRLRPSAPKDPGPGEGLDALEDMTYFQALRNSFRRWTRRWHRQ